MFDDCDYVFSSLPKVEPMSEESTRRARAVVSVMGSTKAERLEIDPATLSDLELYIRGELDAEELRARTVARYRKEP